MARARCSVVIAPPEIAIAPIRSAPQKADQKPMKGPKEKAQKTRSPGPTPAAGKTCSAQMRSHHSHDSAVSSQRIGQVAAERWLGLLIGDDLSLGQERQPLEVVPALDRVQTVAVKGVGTEQ